MNERRDGGADEILSFLDTHGVVDKDSLEMLQRKRKNSNSRKRTSRFVLDLHGMKSDKAESRIRTVLQDCRNKNIRELLIIHGKGYHSDPAEGPVLKKLVRDMLEGELRNSVRDFRTALPKDGGEGATLVYLK